MKLFDDYLFAKGLEDTTRDVYYSGFDFKGARAKLQSFANEYQALKAVYAPEEIWKEHPNKK